MRWINKLERKYGRYGITNLMQYIVAGNAIVFLLMEMYGRVFMTVWLGFHPAMVLQGQVWRLVTFIFVPPHTNLLWLFFILYFYYWVGMGLEREWGKFKFNLFYLTGMLLTITASLLTGSLVSAFYLNLAIFLAFAQIYPDFEIRLLLVLPIKVKYLAWFNLAFIAWSLVVGPLSTKIMSLVPIATFLLFFGDVFIRDIKLRRQVQQNRKRFQSEVEKAKRNK